MASQNSMGLFRILILVGAGYTGTILAKNGKLSELLDPQSKGDSDAIAAQVRQLAMEIRQMASRRQIAVLNGNSGQIGNLSSLVIPAATLGALGYGYMWWKGLSFSDLMCVGKCDMDNATLNIAKHLDDIYESIAEMTRRHPKFE